MAGLAGTVSRLVALEPNDTTIDNDCYEDFGESWWDEHGPVGPLHAMNPARVDFFHEVLEHNLDRRAAILDVGCGGGILSEGLARRGWQMTGVDISQKTIDVARAHAVGEGLQIIYRVASAYELPQADATVDAVILSDVLEHLVDLPKALSEVARVLKPGGLFLFDTINRTKRAYALMIFLAQQVFKIVHPDTHDYKLFVTPSELDQLVSSQRMRIAQLRGISPTSGLPALMMRTLRRQHLGEFEITDDLAVNYIGYAVKEQS